MNHRIPKPDATDPDRFELEVVQYLSKHPDFFVRHPNTLSTIQVPHASGGAVSLIEKQVEMLRNQLEDYQLRLDELMAVAKENDALQSRMHRLTLELIDAATFDEVLTALEDELHDDFQADAVELRLFSAAQLSQHLDQELPNHSTTFETFFKHSRPICGPLRGGQLEYIFGAESTDIASAALIPLQTDGVLGLLAIGSRDPRRFAPQQGTEFLTRLGEVISHTLKAVSLPGL
jgi:uncharacterized protein YigA (DUF484 family)